MERKRDMSKVKCYDFKKDGHFAKDFRKAKVKDYNYYKINMMLSKKDNDDQVLFNEDQTWMKISSDSKEELNTITEVSYYSFDSESEYEFDETSYYYGKSELNYGLFVNNDDEQEFFHDANELASENFDENLIVIGLGYTLMLLTRSDEALEIEKFKRAIEHKVEFVYDYGNLNASYMNEEINILDDYFQGKINPAFKKIDSPFQQTSFGDDDVLGVLSLELSYDVMMIGKAYVDHGRKQVLVMKVKCLEKVKVWKQGLSINEDIRRSLILVAKLKSRSNQESGKGRFNLVSELRSKRSRLALDDDDDGVNGRISLDSRLNASYDMNVMHVVEDVSISNSRVSKMSFRKKSGDSFQRMNIVHICLWILDSGCSKHMTEASSSQSWLWHQHLSHLNFTTINNLVKDNLVPGLPKMKFEKVHFCSACEQGKIYRKHHKSKAAFTSNKLLCVFHMDLCGLMRVKCMNGKRYMLVVVMIIHSTHGYCFIVRKMEL
ncbi:retrovirus-related pol polyprotein from transposon TNT 1-94 [Tanacetum coccineum]